MEIILVSLGHYENENENENENELNVKRIVAINFIQRKIQLKQTFCS
jgi:hypothetical protein